MDIFHSPITLAHHFWKQILKPGDHVIDATCGNGKDTAVLASLVLDEETPGSVTGLDIQEEAIRSTLSHLQTTLPSNLIQHVELFCQSHVTFPESALSKELKLIVYNLGYLPGGDKSLTTLLSTTMASITNAMELLPLGGFLSITCYPGHEEGKVESEALFSFLSTLSPREWTVSCHRWENRFAAPFLFVIKKIKS